MRRAPSQDMIPRADRCAGACGAEMAFVNESQHSGDGAAFSSIWPGGQTAAGRTNTSWMRGELPAQIDMWRKSIQPAALVT